MRLFHGVFAEFARNLRRIRAEEDRPAILRNEVGNDFQDRPPRGSCADLRVQRQIKAIDKEEEKRYGISE